MPFAAETIDACLDALAAQIRPDVEKNIEAQWIDFTEDRWPEPVFCPYREPVASDHTWPDLHINDALEDPDVMVLQQLKMASDRLSAGQGGVLAVRCNYGTGILPSLFGCEIRAMPRETHTLPGALPVSRDEIGRILDAGVPDIRTGQGGNVFDTAERLREILAARPEFAHIDIFHPDLQGPIDVVELIWGSDIFVAFYDEPETIRALLDLVTETYIRFMRKWYDLVPPRWADYSVHGNNAYMHKGRLMIREDSLMNLSTETYTDLIQPFDQRLLDELGGGMIHYCGRGEHFVPELSKMPGMSAINLSQPHLNDMEAIYAGTVDKGIKLLDLDATETRRALDAGRLPATGQVSTSLEFREAMKA